MESNVAQLPITDRIWAWFETNKKPTVVGIGLAAVAGLVIWFVLWHQEQQRIEAGNALSDVAVGTSGQRTETPEAYLKVAAAFPKSDAGAQALLLAAGSLFTDGKYTEAQVQFEKFTREYRESPFLGQALLGLAACQEAEGKTEQALNSYKELVTRHPNDSVITQAKFALGRLYEAQGKPELARDMFEQVERANPYGALGSESGMRLEDLNATYPKPVVAPTASSISSNVPVKLQQTLTNLGAKLQSK